MNSAILKELTVKIGSGATPSGGKNSYFKTGISFIRSQNVYDFSFSNNGLAYINDEQARELNNVQLFENDILLNITGDSIARVCMVPNHILPARVNQHVSIIRASKLIDSKYLLCYLVNQKSHLLKICGVGGTRNALTKDVLEKLVIQYPDLKTQEKIGSIIFNINIKIELNNRINTELESMAKTLYDYWFVQFDFPNEDGKPYKSSGGIMVWNEDLKREIPNGWRVCSIDDYAEVKKGELITAKDALNGSIKVVAAGVDYSYLHSTPNRLRNTITISGSGANAGYINFWREPIFASDCITVRGKTDAETLILLQYLNFIQPHILSQATGSAQPHVYPSDIKVLKYAVPDYELIEKYGEVTIPMNDKIGKNLVENQNLTELRDWLLPMLMNGQVTVN
jgi:type I restriction enzyme S subunit